MESENSSSVDAAESWRGWRGLGDAEVDQRRHRFCDFCHMRRALMAGVNDVLGVSKITAADFKPACHKNQWIGEVIDILASSIESP